MADDKKWKLARFSKSDRSTFSVLSSRGSEVNELRWLIYHEGELDRFNFSSLGSDYFGGLSSISFHHGVFVRPADLLALQVGMDPKLLQDCISHFRLDSLRCRSIELDDFTLPLSESWRSNVLLDCLQETLVQNPCYLLPNSGRPAFNHVKSVPQFCPQSTSRASLQRELPSNHEV